MPAEFVAPAGLDPIVVVSYDPSWQSRFADWRDRLAIALGDIAVAIEHVGSTAVPGLSAKPVIDIQVSVTDVDDEASYRSRIESTRVTLRVRESGHRLFRDDVAAGRPRRVHIHVCARGSAWERDHLLFRDYLRAHNERRDAYARLKEDLAARFRNDRVGYTEAKGDFVAQTLALAATQQDESAPGRG
jgi:GrpB-like predicted nucleotidyltransferase (UPF0157 family)